MLEVFTVGGGEYIVNGFNAVAAWTGGGGYRSMLRVVMVMGLIYSLLVVAFNLDWRSWMNWFLQATAIYLCLMVPTITLKVTDRVNPSLAPSVVANVPLGLGVIASFTSQIGDYLTRTAETVFVMPASLNYSSNGIIYGSKLMEATRQIQIRDPEFAANLNEHMKQCVFYDVMLGFKSMKTLAAAPDLWAAIGPGSPARAQKWVVESGGVVTTSILTCRDAYQALNLSWTAMLTDLTPFYAKSLYPKLSNAAASAKLTADLPQTYNAFTGNATSALQIMRQHLAINAFMQARDSMSGGTAAATIDSFAAIRTDIQTRNTYSAIAEGAMKWVPVLNIVLTVVFYAMFPVLFPLFLMPRTGVSALKGYTVGFFYLAAWGPLYVVLHMILMTKATAAGLAAAGGGITLASYAGIGAVNNETATLAGYLISAVPFLAAGMAKGAMAISSQATSYLQPSQNAAEAAALEATTGNYSYGNANVDNATTNTRQANKWTTAADYVSGATAVTARDNAGHLATSFGNGQMVYDSTAGISRLAQKPSLSDGTVTEARSMLSEFQGQSNQYRSMASESTTAANTVGSQLFKTMQTARGRESVTGQGSNSAISESQNLVNSWSENLQNQYGWSKNTADSAARTAYINGGFDVGANGKIGLEALGTGGGVGGGVSAKGSTQQETGQRFESSAQERIQQGFDFLNSEARSSQATQSRDSFYRATRTSSDSEVRGLTQRRDASLTEAQTYSAEASTISDRGKRYESALSATATGGFQWSEDKSQEYVQFAERELAKPMNQSLRDSGYQVWMTGQLTSEQQTTKSVLMRKFESSFIDQMKQDLGPIGPLPARPIDAPSSGSAAEVSAWGNRQIGAANSGAPSISVGGDARDPELTGLVAGRLDGSDGRMEGHRLQAGADGVLAHRLGDGVQDYATERNNSSLIRTMPVVGPAISYVERNLGTTTFDARPFAAAHGVAIKPGSNLSTLDVKMAPVISEVAAQTRGMGLTAPTVTSAQDRRHTSDSLHPDGLAVDFRGNNITVKEGRSLARRVDAQLGPGYDVFFESSKRNPDNNHLHAEYDGKGVPRKRK